MLVVAGAGVGQTNAPRRCITLAHGRLINDVPTFWPPCLKLWAECVSSFLSGLKSPSYFTDRISICQSVAPC